MAELNSLATLLADANLKAYYRFNTGALTTDEKATYTLTNNNTVAEAAGKYGIAADGGNSNTNKNLTIANDLGITSGAISISLWIKLNAEISTGSWQFIAKGDAGTHVSYFIYYAYNSGTRKVGFTRLKQGTAQDNLDYTVTLGTSAFQHLVLTYDGSNISGYHNGVAVPGTTASSGNGASNNFDNFTILSGFDAATNAYQAYASAIIDDVAIFNRALTADEVLTLYREQSTAWFLFM